MAEDPPKPAPPDSSAQPSAAEQEKRAKERAEAEALLAYIPTSIPNQEEEDAAAARMAASPGLAEAVRALAEARRAEEAPRPAQESDLRVYVPPTTPKIVSGHLTRPRAMLNPRRDLGHKTERALGFSPLVKSGFGEVVNDGRGGIKVGLRWKRVAPIVVVLGGLAVLGIYGAAQALSASADGVDAAAARVAVEAPTETATASVVRVATTATSDAAPTATTPAQHSSTAAVVHTSASSANPTPSVVPTATSPGVKPTASAPHTTPTSAAPNASALLFPTN